MKVVIPMAGRGTRLRPHTLNLPKPLLKLCGKSIIEWIVEEISKSSSSKVDEIHFVIGDFGVEVETKLISVAESVGAKGFIHYQKEALGTAHAVYCADSALEGEVFVAFADTIFKGEIKIDSEADGMIWTMLVDNPENYGVVKANEEGIITDFIEKPKELISKNAIVGLYYFKEAEKLRAEIKNLIDNSLTENNEYQITNCLESLKVKGDKLKCAELEEWLDCGTKTELLNTNKRLIELSNRGDSLVDASAKVSSTEIGEFVSIAKNAVVTNSSLSNCIIYEGAAISNCSLKDSIIGSSAVICGLKGQVFVGDYTEIYND